MFLKRHHYLNKRMPLMKKFHWIALIFTLASLLAACGPTGPAEVQLTLSEFGISPDDITVPAGEVIFQIQNDGALEHDFVIEGVTGESGLILPGASGTFQVTLSPGTYTIICSVAGHKEAGMVGTLVVQGK